PAGRLRQLAATVADLAHVEPGETVQVALTVGVVDVGTLAADDHGHVVLGVRRHPGEVHPEVLPGRGRGRVARWGGVVRHGALLSLRTPAWCQLRSDCQDSVER